MTSRPWPTPRSPTGSHCGRRRSSKGSRWARCSPAPSARCRFPAEDGYASGLGVLVAVSGRFPLLLLLGVVAVVLQPTREMVLLWVGISVAVTLLDIVVAVSPRRLDLQREPVGQVRLGAAGSTSLLVANTSGRRLRGWLRDAWQPSAGATTERHRLSLPGGERRRFTTALLPTRRGDRLADRVTIRSFGPLGIGARQRSFAVDGAIRALPPFGSRKHLPSRLATLRQLDGRSAVRVRGQGTEFDSLRDY